jgi:hypothetical protein
MLETTEATEIAVRTDRTLRLLRPKAPRLVLDASNFPMAFLGRRAGTAGFLNKPVIINF